MMRDAHSGLLLLERQLLLHGETGRALLELASLLQHFSRCRIQSSDGPAPLSSPACDAPLSTTPREQLAFRSAFY